ncbi:MAG: two-component regulator propeller domain-containing protein, partial [Candidatus Parabeggiatoa sp.]|nr:two-component regulator propeller domain-containing protein [Candidatus Parabeggiatoa sp.]
MTGEWSILNTNHFRLPKIEITDILSDGNGGLWVGTRGGGLAHRSVLDEWSVFDDKSGLPSNWITGLLADNNGLWMSFGAWGVSGGLAHLSFTQKTTLVQSIQDEGTRTELLNDKRAAILIHPRGQGSGVTQALSIERMSAHIYRTLQNRGYDNDEIYFLSHKPDVDINGDGMVDRNVVDAPVKSFDKVKPRDLTHADVQQAFEWAKQKGKLDQPLLVIFVDHALTGQLRLDPFMEVLTAQDLNALLTDYQQATGSEVVVILEACHTGSLVNGLAGPNRLIITSTAENQAYYENLGMFSFSKFFFDNLRRGESFYDAFQTVSGKLPTYGHPFNLQIPQLDDDGDGLANNSTDGRLAQKWCLNGCFGALSGEITLEPETVSAPVTKGQTTPLIVRAGITEGRIKRVWALVMTPEAAKQRNQEGFSLIPTPVVNLTQQADDPSRWQGAFSGFQYRGDYVVTFMAEDNEGFI